MHDTAPRAAGALDELAAELRHADALITEQQARIETLERQDPPAGAVQGLGDGST